MWLANNLDNLLLLLGSALIVIGVAQWSIPAAFITAGIVCIAYAVLIAKDRANA